MTVAATLPITTFAITRWGDRALSEEAQILRNLINDASAFSGSMAVGEPKRTVQEALDTAYVAAQAENWDGEGSARVEPSTYVYASQFIQLLPSTASLPDIAADTDGEILFEWDRGRRRIFSVSVGRDGTLTFAGLFGHTKIHGTEHLREVLSVVISDYLARLSSSSRD
jgi:hypothetical protein